MIRLRIEGETPAKKNSKKYTCKNGKVIVYNNSSYQEWYRFAKLQVENQKKLFKDVIPLAGELMVSIEFHHGDNRKRDSDNGLSSILDLLVDCGILVDDKWQIVRKIKVTNQINLSSFCIISVDNI